MVCKHPFLPLPLPYCCVKVPFGAQVWEWFNRLEVEIDFGLLCYQGAIFHKQGNNVRRTLSSMKAGLQISLVLPSNCVVGMWPQGTIFSRLNCIKAEVDIIESHQ